MLYYFKIPQVPFRLLYPTKLPITIDGVRHSMINQVKQNLSTNPALQKALEGKLKPKEDNHTTENTKNK